jgi:molybdate transport system substrate-binding protein
MQSVLAPILAAFAWLTLPLGSACAESSPSPTLTVFAAASLSEAVAELAARFERDERRSIRLSFAASSTLARQIENGASADVFLSADEEWMAYLDERRLVAPGTWIRPIGNRLVMVAPVDRARPVELQVGLDLAAILGDGRLAIGDPAHVPAGRYARQALEYLGAWAVAEPRLARAESVRAALALVERGETPLGIVYATDARISKAVRVVAEFPAASHEPIRYSFALIAGHESNDARELLAWLTSPAGLAIFRAHGFETP